MERRGFFFSSFLGHDCKLTLDLMIKQFFFGKSRNKQPKLFPLFSPELQEGMSPGTFTPLTSSQQ